MKMTKELIAFATVGVVSVASLAACDMRGLQVPPVPARAEAVVETSQVQTQSAQTNAEANTDEASLREFMKRFITPYFGYGPTLQTPPDPEISLGKIPSQFPSDLPLPEDARVLGGVGRGEFGAELIVDATQAPDATVKAVRARLEALGWKVPAANYQPGGFTTMQNAMVTLCKGNDGPALFIQAQALKSGVTDVRYSLNTFKGMPRGSFGPCDQSGGPPSYMPPQVPSLVSPAGSGQYGMGSSGSPDNMAQYASVETSLGVIVLRGHYDAQLEKAQWTLRDKGGDVTLAWSRWTTKNDKGETHSGFLFVMDQTEDKADAKPIRYVYLQVSLAGAASAGGGPGVNVLIREAVRQLP
jgi:hypothetical protein